MATKKASKKVIAEKVIEPVIESKKYSIWIKFNDTEMTINTDDIKESLLEIKPNVLKTRVLLQITSNNGVCDKMLSCTQAKQVFRNKLAMTVFLNRLIFK